MVSWTAFLFVAMVIMFSVLGFVNGFTADEPIPEAERTLCSDGNINEIKDSDANDSTSITVPAGVEEQTNRVNEVRKRRGGDMLCDRSSVEYAAFGSVIQAAFDWTFYRWYEVGLALQGGGG